MAMTPYPLAVPNDLLAEVREASVESGASMADVMRQTMKIGLPQYRRQFKGGGRLKSFSVSEAKAAFAPDAEFDQLEKTLARRSRPQPEAD